MENMSNKSSKAACSRGRPSEEMCGGRDVKMENPSLKILQNKGVRCKHKREGDSRKQITSPSVVSPDAKPQGGNPVILHFLPLWEGQTRRLFKSSHTSYLPRYHEHLTSHSTPINPPPNPLSSPRNLHQPLHQILMRSILLPQLIPKPHRQLQPLDRSPARMREEEGVI